MPGHTDAIRGRGVSDNPANRFATLHYTSMTLTHVKERRRRLRRRS